ncbi:MAG: electron transport complex subunit RsxC [Clostridia bacterium]|nr:electron transport complex subunit RsxC [Clostridia bacterium]
MNTFANGIHPKDNKERTRRSPITPLAAPQTVYIPLGQHVGKEAVPTVAKGDRVQMGQKIGGADGAISASVFSSVSGEVTGIEKRATATGHCMHVVIQNDGKDDEVLLPPLADPTPAQIVQRIEDCGIVGMGGAGFPTAVKLRPRDRIDTLLINAAECEPYLTCDYRIMKEKAVSFLRGARYMAQALGLSEFTVGIEDNKSDVAEELENTAKHENIAAKIVVCHTKYPQGAEKQLIYAVTGRKVRVGKLPASVGVIVQNVHTALAVCEAVELGRKSFCRVVTVSGDGARQAGNYSVRTGTLVSDVLAACGGVGDNVVKLLSGGPMMGFALSDGDVAVTKTTSGLVLLTAAEAEHEEASSCINCAACVRACPMHLMPVYIDACILSGDTAGAKKYGAMDCIECGSCAYVCPARRPLVQSIRLAKKKIRARGANK